LPINATSSETDFAFDAIVGEDYEIAPHWDLGASYQYTWIDVKHLGAACSVHLTATNNSPLSRAQYVYINVIHGHERLTPFTWP
jgi:hypothetical protein